MRSYAVGPRGVTPVCSRPGRPGWVAGLGNRGRARWLARARLPGRLAGWPGLARRGRMGGRLGRSGRASQLGRVAGLVAGLAGPVGRARGQAA